MSATSREDSLYFNQANDKQDTQFRVWEALSAVTLQTTPWTRRRAETALYPTFKNMLCVCVHMDHSTHMEIRGQHVEVSSLFAMWVLGVELKLSGMAVGPFTYQAISLTLTPILRCKNWLGTSFQPAMRDNLGSMAGQKRLVALGTAVTPTPHAFPSFLPIPHPSATFLLACAGTPGA